MFSYVYVFSKQARDLANILNVNDANITFT